METENLKIDELMLLHVDTLDIPLLFSTLHDVGMAAFLNLKLWVLSSFRFSKVAYSFCGLTLSILSQIV